MDAILKTLVLVYPLAIFLAPFVYYKKPRNNVMSFCRKMASDVRCRRCYTLAIPVASLLYSFVFFKVKEPSLWEMPGLLVGLLLLREKFTSATLSWLHEDRVIQWLYFALFLFSLIRQELSTFSVTLATVMLASLFYPSKKVIRVMANPGDYPEFHNTNDEIFRMYF